MTLIFDLLTSKWITRDVGNLPANLGLPHLPVTEYDRLK